VGFEAGATTSAWIALADSVPENGCMRAVPDPRRRQPRPADAGADASRGPSNRRVTAVKVDENEAVEVVLRAGEMSLHDIDIVHGSGPNHSREKRIGFVVRYVTPQARPLEGRPPAILARGRDPEGHFQLVDPPRETAVDQSLRHMRESAARHLEVMLHNLQSFKSQPTLAEPP
jgi:ectoine hydroxylase-related dioxygenase (phytanoyl-CoA dioxygenase family)